MRWQNPVHASGCPAAASAQGYGALGQEVVVFAAAVQEGKKALLELLQETLLLSPVGSVLSVGLEWLPTSPGYLAEHRVHHQAGREQCPAPHLHADAVQSRKGFGKRWAEARRGDLRARLQLSSGSL